MFPHMELFGILTQSPGSPYSLEFLLPCCTTFLGVWEMYLGSNLSYKKQKIITIKVSTAEHRIGEENIIVMTYLDW